jgi:hypothetical protein
MKKITHILIFSLLYITASSCYAQNLVPNPSFELYDTCPYSGSQISFATPWQGVTTNSTDYFNACSSTYTSVPTCGAGWQYARTGGGYAAIWAINGYGSNYREYLRVKLDSALIQDSCYLVEFYANLYNLSCYGIGKLGACISTTSSNVTGPGLILQTPPQIVSHQLITDTLNWTRVYGYYKALGGEQYITVGNFESDVTTDTVNVQTSGCSGSYYLIDDIRVEKITACDSTGTVVQAQNKKDVFLLYPNPNNGNMLLEYNISEQDKSILEITGLTGNRVQQYSLPAGENKLRIRNEGLESGMYIYHVIMNDKIVKSDKLLIIK